MNAQQALQVVRYAKSAFPSQKLDEYTPDVWSKALAGFDFHETISAVDRLVLKQTWASAAEIVAEIKAHRRSGSRSAVDQRVFREIEARREAFDLEASRRAAAETRAAFQAALDAKWAREAAAVEEAAEAKRQAQERDAEEGAA